MKVINNEKGFTVMELIIVLCIIAVGMALSVYSINIIFSSKADAFASQYRSDLRYIKDQTMATSGYTYHLEWKDEGSGKVSYILYKDAAPIKEVFIHKAIEVTYSGGSLNGVKVLFDTTDGNVIDDESGNNGAGTYHFINDTSDADYSVTLIKATGRID